MLARACVDAPFERCSKLFLHQFAQSWILFDNQNVIRWLAQQPRANAIAQALHRITHQASRSNCCVNKVVETLSLSGVRQTFLSIHDQTAAAPALKPLS